MLKHVVFSVAFLMIIGTNASGQDPRDFLRQDYQLQQRLRTQQPQTLPTPQVPNEEIESSAKVVSSSKPTFDCAKAQKPIALIICSGEDGARADWALSTAAWAYTFTLDEQGRSTFSKAEDDWIKSLNQLCHLTSGTSANERGCVIGNFNARAKALESKLTGDALAETKLTLEQRALIQDKLISLGFLHDDADGEFGPNTRIAIKQFQQSHGFEESNYLTAQQRQLLLSGSETSKSEPSARPSETAGFKDFEQLLGTPGSCWETRRLGRSQMYVRDPFSGRNVPGPVCAMVAECLTELSDQIGAIVGYLRERPLFLAELRQQSLQFAGQQYSVDALLQNMANAARLAQSDVPRQECSFVYTTVDSGLFSLDNRGLQARSGFEPFATVGHEYLTKLRSIYAANLEKYQQWLRFAHHYSRAEEFAQVKAKYELAYDSSDIEAFLRARSEFWNQQSAAEDFKSRLLRQSEELLALENQLTDLSRQAAEDPVSKVVDVNAVGGIDDLKSDITHLSQIAPETRGDVADQIAGLTGRKRDIESKINLAVGRIDDLKRREHKRQELVTASTDALSDLSDESLKRRLGEAGHVVVGQLDAARTELAALAEKPLLERPDYNDVLRLAEAALTQAKEIKIDAKEIDEFADSVSRLIAKIDDRGRRYLDSNADEVVRSLHAAATTFAQKTLPLNDADHGELTDQVRMVASVDAKLPMIMDAGERKYLASQFPMSHANWDFQYKIDKLTDAVSVIASTVTAGDQARYQIEISCNASSRALSITTFEASGEKGKTIGWDNGIMGTPTKNVRIRADTDAAYAITMRGNGYNNSAIASPFDPEFKFINSSRLVFGDVFPSEQVEVATNFPTPFKRLCVLLASK
jgi:peptidoglycan hydrolase-like protein with peptidoglycan-binding domain